MSHLPVALITGSGTRRIGYHVALEAARRGYAVALHYRRSAEEAADIRAELIGSGAVAEIFQGDLSFDRENRRLIDAVRDRFGRIDLLVTAAAVWTECRLEEITDELLLEAFRSNTAATFFSARAAGELMVRQPEGGAVVTLGDWAVSRPYLDYAHYFVSKGSIATLTVTLAKELAARNPRVRVNCVHPGAVMVPESVPVEEQKQIAEATLVKRLGEPKHVVQAVFSTVTNDFLTGACIMADGGRSIN